MNYVQIFSLYLKIENELKKRKVLKYLIINFMNLLKKKLPFELTSSQEKVLAQINLDLMSNNRMFRIIQGDVGSGKTIVSLLAIINIIKSGYQCALMSPTEILSKQHYELTKKIFKEINIKIDFLTGKTEYKERKEILNNLKNGKTQLLIGTHALFQKKLNLKNLDLL